MPTGQTDGRTPDRYIVLSARRGQRTKLNRQLTVLNIIRTYLVEFKRVTSPAADKLSKFFHLQVRNTVIVQNASAQQTLRYFTL